MSLIEDLGQTDRVTALPRPYHTDRQTDTHTNQRR